jgi:hypothetical protein
MAIVINFIVTYKILGNKYVYNFPRHLIFAAGSGIGVSNISIYNFNQNITHTKKKCVVTLLWLERFIHLFSWRVLQCQHINFFSTTMYPQWIIRDSNGQDNVYFFELVVNSIRYSTSSNFYAMQRMLQARLGYTKRQTHVDMQYHLKHQFIILDNHFGNLSFHFLVRIHLQFNRQMFSTFRQVPQLSPVQFNFLNLISTWQLHSVPNNIYFCS